MRAMHLRGRTPLYAVACTLYLLGPAPVLAADVYEWRDANGEEHMADQPPPGNQAGVELLRVNGNDVNMFHDAADEAAVAAAASDPAADGAQTSTVPHDDADCAAIHGGPCSWADEWSRYARANCVRVGDGLCDDDHHLRAFYDPRKQYQAAHSTAHAR